MNDTITEAINGFIPVATGLVPGSAAQVLTESVFIKDSVFSYIDENGDTVVGAKQNKINKIFNETLNSVATEDDIKNIFSGDWNSGSNPDSGPKYLAFTAEEDNIAISLYHGATAPSPDIKYSLNGGEWTQWDYSAITLNAGDTVRMKGNNNNGFSTNYNSYNAFRMTGKMGASGNIMSLLYEDDFEGKLTIPCDYCFDSLFFGCTYLTTAPELPATTLALECYNNMFGRCTYLTTAPELPATTLAERCYELMFDACTSLTTAPELPATTLANNCYEYMFKGCTSLTTAPELPATTLANSCYNNMFYNCTALTTTPVELPATTLTPGCYNNMFDACTSLTTAPELPATTLANSCYNEMFRGCTSLTTAPELPATTLAIRSYRNMFYGCTKLNYIKMLATDISAYNCLDRWVYGVSSTGTFVKHPDMTSLPTGEYGIPSGWTVEDAA